MPAAESKRDFSDDDDELPEWFKEEILESVRCASLVPLCMSHVP